MAADRWLVWDFDGTLGRRTSGWSHALLEVLQRHAPGLTTSADQIRPHLLSGYPWHTPLVPHTYIATADQWWDMLAPVFARAFMAVGATATQAAELARRVPAAYVELRNWELFADVLPVLGQLRREGWAHAILSNHVPELPNIVTGLDLGEHVPHVFSSARIGYEKPCAAAFDHAWRAMGRPKTVWMIGDNPVGDIAGAAGMGWPGILVRKTDPGVQYCCEDLWQVPAILARA